MKTFSTTLFAMLLAFSPTLIVADTFDDSFDAGEINDRWLVQRNNVGTVDIEQKDGQAIVTATGGNANGGLASIASFDPATEGIKVTFEIAEVIGGPNANGFLVGIVDDNSIFHRNANNFGIAMFGQEARTFSSDGFSLIAGDRNGSGEADFILDEGEEVDMESYLDGFTVTLSADAAGWSYKLEGLQDFDLNDVVFENQGTWDAAGTSFGEIFGADDEWHVVTANQSPGEKITIFERIVLGTAEGPQDADDDGMPDSWEQANDLDPEVDDSGLDPDEDGLTNLQEFEIRSDPQLADTDGDGLNDGDELNAHATNPKNSDTDDDGISDGAEIANGTDPKSTDTDGDGLSDKWELDNGTNATNANSPAGITLGELGDPTEVWNEIMELPSFDAYEGDLDQADATFRVCIDFEDKQDSEREVIFETGAGTIGFSMVYEEGNKLVLRSAGNGGLSLAVAEAVLSPSVIAAGEIEVMWSYEVGDAAGGSQAITLWLNQFPVAAVTMDLGGDWSGSDGASFGVASSNLAGTGANSGLTGTDFISGSINLEKGLQFFGERIPVVESIDIGSGVGFAITAITRNAVTNVVTLTWVSSPGASYSVDSSVDLKDWLEVQDGIESDGAETSYTEPDASAENYYRIRREQ